MLNKQITEKEYNETVKYYKAIRKLPAPFMLKENKNGTFRYVKYKELTEPVRILLNDYKKAR